MILDVTVSGDRGSDLAFLRATAPLEAEPVGTMHLVRVGGKPTVARVEVPREEHLRQGIATRLYEEAARFACDAWGAPLHSDTMRWPGSEGFWRKQRRKKRAACAEPAPPGSVCRQYRLICPAPASLAFTREEGFGTVQLLGFLALGAGALVLLLRRKPPAETETQRGGAGARG